MCQTDHRHENKGNSRVSQKSMVYTCTHPPFLLYVIADPLTPHSKSPTTFRNLQSRQFHSILVMMHKFARKLIHPVYYNNL